MRIKKEVEIKNLNPENIKEIFIADPTKINVELNNELNSISGIMVKLSKMLNAQKLKIEKLEKKHQQLLEDHEELKQYDLNSSRKSENNSNEKKLNKQKNNMQADLNGTEKKQIINNKVMLNTNKIKKITNEALKNFEINIFDKSNCKNFFYLYFYLKTDMKKN